MATDVPAPQAEDLATAGGETTPETSSKRKGTVTQKKKAPHWAWYTTGIVSSALVAICCAANAYTHMTAVGLPLLWVVLAAAAGFILNYILYFFDCPGELKDLLSPEEATPEKVVRYKTLGKIFKAVAFAASVINGVLGFGFTLNNALPFETTLFAFITAIGFAIVTFTLTYAALKGIFKLFTKERAPVTPAQSNWRWALRLVFMLPLTLLFAVAVYATFTAYTADFTNMVVHTWGLALPGGILTAILLVVVAAEFLLAWRSGAELSDMLATAIVTKDFSAFTSWWKKTPLWKMVTLIAAVAAIGLIGLNALGNAIIADPSAISFLPGNLNLAAAGIMSGILMTFYLVMTCIAVRDRNKPDSDTFILPDSKEGRTKMIVTSTVLLAITAGLFGDGLAEAVGSAWPVAVLPLVVIGIGLIFLGLNNACSSNAAVVPKGSKAGSDSTSTAVAGGTGPASAADVAATGDAHPPAGAGNEGANADAGNGTSSTHTPTQ